MAFWQTKRAVDDRADERRVERSRWADRLTSIQVRTLRAVGPPRPTQGLSVRQKLADLAVMYQVWLDERRAWTPGEAPQVVRTWTGGLQSWWAIHERATAISVAADAPLEAEMLARITRVSQSMVQGLIGAARRAGVDPAGQLTGRPAPDVLAALGVDASAGPISQLAFAARYGARPPSARVDAEAWWAHWRANFAWNNEVLYGDVDAVGWMPPELLPEEHRGRQTLPPLQLDDTATRALHMAYEMGTDPIALQTTISMSGDVINQISPHIPLADQALMLEVHRRGVESALFRWTSIIDAVALFVGNLLNAANPKRGS